MAVDFGVFVPQGWKMDLVDIEDPFEQYEAMTRVARVAEETGAYDSIWVYDHFHCENMGGDGPPAGLTHIFTGLQEECLAGDSSTGPGASPPPDRDGRDFIEACAFR
jgi:alkanesulfonate monooxygenase SsuD/methylene tetrahydromethanopterin reductase-like flavin-dependent oxidoreductase (luciferase family)